MPALTGQVITTITDNSGNPAVQVTWFFDPTPALNVATWVDNDNVSHPPGTVPLNTLRNNTVAWTDARGTVWGIGTVAAVGVNLTAGALRTVMGTTDLTDPQHPVFTVLRRVLLPANTGQGATKAQLLLQPPPDGPYVFAQDFNGMTFDLSGAQ